MKRRSEVKKNFRTKNVSGCYVIAWVFQARNDFSIRTSVQRKGLKLLFLAQPVNKIAKFHNNIVQKKMLLFSSNGTIYLIISFATYSLFSFTFQLSSLSLLVHHLLFSLSLSPLSAAVSLHTPSNRNFQLISSPSILISRITLNLDKMK